MSLRLPTRILALLALALAWAAPPPSAHAQTSPISGAVALPASADLRAPVPDGERVRILSGYSPSGGSSLHDGTDRTSYANDYYALDLVYADRAESGLGQPIVAPLDGVVVKAGWATSGWANYGQRVILRHDLGDGHTYHTLYAHLSRIDVSEGDHVARGETIGALGRSCQGALSCSSFSTPHLHFAMHRDSSIGGSGTGGSYGGHAVVPEAFDGAEHLAQGDVLTSSNGAGPSCGDGACDSGESWARCPDDCAPPDVATTELVTQLAPVDPLAPDAGSPSPHDGDGGAGVRRPSGSAQSGSLVGEGCSVARAATRRPSAGWVALLALALLGARRRLRRRSGRGHGRGPVRTR